MRLLRTLLYRPDSGSLHAFYYFGTLRLVRTTHNGDRVCNRRSSLGHRRKGLRSAAFGGTREWLLSAWGCRLRRSFGRTTPWNPALALGIFLRRAPSYRRIQVHRPRIGRLRFGEEGIQPRGDRRSRDYGQADAHRLRMQSRRNSSGAADSDFGHVAATRLQDDYLQRRVADRDPRTRYDAAPGIGYGGRYCPSPSRYHRVKTGPLHRFDHHFLLASPKTGPSRCRTDCQLVLTTCGHRERSAPDVLKKGRGPQ